MSIFGAKIRFEAWLNEWIQGKQNWTFIKTSTAISQKTLRTKLEIELTFGEFSVQYTIILIKRQGMGVDLELRAGLKVESFFWNLVNFFSSEPSNGLATEGLTRLRQEIFDQEEKRQAFMA